MKSIYVSMPDFTVSVRQDGNEIRLIRTCSFGRPHHRTPEIRNGSLSLTKRDRLHHSTIYGGALMPFALFFEQDLTCAFHEGQTSEPSHGCIHLGHDNAKWLFDWAGSDPVTLDIIGPPPETGFCA